MPNHLVHDLDDLRHICGAIVGIQAATSKLARRRLRVTRTDPLTARIRHFRHVIRGREPPRVTGDDAVRTLARATIVAAIAGW